jgi:hypothetical protein
MNNRRQGSRYNATKHGIFAGILISGGTLGDSVGNYTALLSGLRAAIKPTDQFEGMLVETLAFLYLRLSRVYQADWDSAPKLFRTVGEALDGDYPKADTEYIDRNDEVLIVRNGPAPDLLIRYEAAIERQICRTLSRLEQWRAIRQGRLQPAS